MSNIEKSSTEEQNIKIDNENEIDWIKNNLGKELRSGKMTMKELRKNVLGVNSSSFDFSKAIKQKEEHEEAIELLNKKSSF